MLSVVVQRGNEPPLLVTKGAPERWRRHRAPSARTVLRPDPQGRNDRLKKLVDGSSARASAWSGRSRVLRSDELTGLTKEPAAPPRPPRLPSCPTPIACPTPPARARPHVRGVIRQRPAQAGRRRGIAELAKQGIALKIITGDNDHGRPPRGRTRRLNVEGVLTGDQMRKMSHPALVARAKTTTIFARVDPDQKLLVIARCETRARSSATWATDQRRSGPARGRRRNQRRQRHGRGSLAADSSCSNPAWPPSPGRRRGPAHVANTLKYIRMARAPTRQHAQHGRARCCCRSCPDAGQIFSTT